MSGSLGDFKLGTTVYDYFTTAAADTGAPTTLSGTPAVSVYEDNSDTPITSGVTLDVDADSTTGLIRLTIVATGANGYEVGKQYTAVITTGTVGGTSAVGYVVSKFSIEKTGLNLSNTTLTDGATVTLGIADSGTAAAIAAGTITLRSGAAFGDNTLAGCVVQATGSTQGYPQYNVIASNVGSTDVCTLVANWPVTPSGTVTYVVFGAPSASSIAIGSVTGAVGSVTGNVGGNVVGSVGSVTGNVGGNVVGSIGSLGATAQTNVQTSAQAALTASGITTADGITKIAGVSIEVGGTDPASPIGQA